MSHWQWNKANKKNVALMPNDLSDEDNEALFHGDNYLQ